jgi:hypothetical protein
MKKANYLIVFITCMLSSFLSISQTSDLYIPLNMKKAYNKQTRSTDGAPGKNYWQNRADYAMDINFDPKTCILSGKEQITYFNNSKDTLDRLTIQLLSNLFKKGNARDVEIEQDAESDGVIIESLVVDGENMDVSSETSQVEFEHTNMYIRLPKELLPARQMKLDIKWHYTVNQKSHLRTGAVDSTTYFIAYFFPRIAVYDDIDGWINYRYTGYPEFYNDFGNFEVSVKIPQNFVVWATGTLENSKEVLTEKYANRYFSAISSDSIVHIINSDEMKQKNITTANSYNVWKFKAENVSDFAFATSDHYLWDATGLTVDKKTGSRVLISAAYNKNSKDFFGVAAIARKAIEFMSFSLPGVAFPYPRMTVFNGLDEMEYPMIVNNISNTTHYETVKLTTHEVLHTYLPFYMGCNESKYAWMDEGFTSFCDYIIAASIDTISKGYIYGMPGYKDNMGNDNDLPIFSSSSHIRTPVYWWNSYCKPAIFFFILKDYLGEATFKTALQKFMERWNGKHPMPYDLFFTFMNISGENLDWLIKPWFFDFGNVDLGIKDVVKNNDVYRITIEKKGSFPAPVQLKLLFMDGSTEIIHKNAGIWKDKNIFYTIDKQTTKIIKQVELLDVYQIDADKSNDRYLVK